MLEEFAPLWTGEAHRPLRDFLGDVEQQGSAQADALHRLEILCDALPRNVAVHPKPVNAGPGRRRGFEETLLEADFRAGTAVAAK